MERETGLGLDRAQTWPGHVTTTFVSPQTAARHQTVEKTGELWMAAGEMILHILSLVSTLCLLPSGWLKRSGLLGTTELPIKHFYWPTTLALRWQWRKRKCGYLDPFLSHYLITAQCSGSQSRNQPSPRLGLLYTAIQSIWMEMALIIMLTRLGCFRKYTWPREGCQSLNIFRSFHKFSPGKK